MRVLVAWSLIRRGGRWVGTVFEPRSLVVRRRGTKAQAEAAIKRYIRRKGLPC